MASPFADAMSYLKLVQRVILGRSACQQHVFLKGQEHLLHEPLAFVGVERYLSSNSASEQPPTPSAQRESSQSKSSHQGLPKQEGTEQGDQNDSKEYQGSLNIDRAGLQLPKDHHHGSTSHKETETPVTKHLKALIRFRGGPITVAEFMSEALTNPAGGYYMTRDVFGSKGDFVTSPEVSQVFGELLGIWSVCLWQQMGCPGEVRLVELGPGRGTLMSDLLRGTASFPKFAQALNVHLVELSPALRTIQREKLQCVGSQGAASGDPGVEKEGLKSTITGVPVRWHASMETVPAGPSIIIAHEFVDALPVHQFQRTSRGWCERLIDLAEDSSPQHFRFVLSRDVTPAQSLYLSQRLTWLSEEERARLPSLEVCPGALQLGRDIAQRVANHGGGALLIDYGEDGPVKDSLQAIKKHKFAPLLSHPGNADLSAYVDFAAIRHSVQGAKGAQAYGPITQAQLLGALGINVRVEALLRNATEAQAEALERGYMRLVGDHPGDKETPPGMGTRYKALAIAEADYGAPVPFQ